jgi:hypothetical protein
MSYRWALDPRSMHWSRLASCQPFFSLNVGMVENRELSGFRLENHSKATKRILTGDWRTVFPSLFLPSDIFPRSSSAAAQLQPWRRGAEPS